MFSVNTNLGAMAALEALTATQTDLQKTQNEIATGQKVSDASDNPAVYAIAQSMQATISGLSAVSDNLNFAQSVVSVASSAGTDISSQLATLMNTVTAGQQTGIAPRRSTPRSPPSCRTSTPSPTARPSTGSTSPAARLRTRR